MSNAYTPVSQMFWRNDAGVVHAGDDSAPSGWTPVYVIDPDDQDGCRRFGEALKDSYGELASEVTLTSAELVAAAVADAARKLRTPVQTYPVGSVVRSRSDGNLHLVKTADDASGLGIVTLLNLTTGVTRTAKAPTSDEYENLGMLLDLLGIDGGRTS